MRLPTSLALVLILSAGLFGQSSGPVSALLGTDIRVGSFPQAWISGRPEAPQWQGHYSAISPALSASWKVLVTKRNATVHEPLQEMWDQQASSATSR